jgi:hypothetical protein
VAVQKSASFLPQLVMRTSEPKPHSFNKLLEPISKSLVGVDLL